MGWKQYVAAAFVLVACSKNQSTTRDAAAGEDAFEIDARSIDGAVDAPPDAVPDAPPPPSMCSSTASLLVDVAPSRISNIVRVGDTLYIGTYELDENTQNDTNARLLTYNLTTGMPAASPMAFQSRPYLSGGDGEAWASDFASGTIWRLQASASPTAIVTGRPNPGAVVAEGGYVYWAEAVPPSQQETVIKRRLVAGGTVEPVTTCDNPRDLSIIGNDIYVGDFFQGVISRAPKTGGTAVPITSNGYPLMSMVRDGNDLYFVTLKPTAEIYRVSTPNGPATLVKEMTDVGRFEGIALSPTYIFVAGDYGVRRIRRTTNVMEPIYTGGCGEDPVLRNNEIIVVKKDSEVIRCVD